MSAAPISSTNSCGADKSVAKNNVGFHAEFFSQGSAGNAVLIAFMSQDVRVGHSRNHVNDITVARQNRREGLITFSMPLFGESNPKVSRTSFPSVPNASL